MKKILSLGKYTMDGELLGCGNFGRVELATHILTSVKVAVKIIDTRKLSTVYASKNLYREARILAQIRHPYIGRMYETLKASYLYCLILEYIPNKSLGAYLKTLRRSMMGESESWPMIRQVTSALVFLHRHNIVHRDLKMDNILIDEDNNSIKIIDFGLSNMFVPGELLKTHCGSPEFAAPELFYDRHDYGPEVDAWSFGVIVYGVLVGQLPFTPGSTEPSKRHALLKMLNKGLTREHKTQMVHLSIDCRGMLFQLIEPNPELRLSMEKAVNHSWITRGGHRPLECDTEPMVDKPLHAKVVSKLAEQHQLDPEYIENHVSQYKYDCISSQYNMLMDKYSHLRRVQKITTASIRPRRKVKVAVPSKPPTLTSRRPISPPVRMSKMMDGKTMDDTFIGAAAYMGNKLINRQALKDEGKFHLSLPRPIITVSSCGTSYGTEELQPVLESGSHLTAEVSGSSYIISSEKAETKKKPFNESVTIRRDASSSSIQGADNCNPMTTSSASTAIVQELAQDDSLSPEDIMHPSSSAHHLSADAADNPDNNLQLTALQVHMVKVSADHHQQHRKKLTQSSNDPTKSGLRSVKQ